MQRWWIVAVALVGIGLAFFLFPRPDRGEAPSEPAPAANVAEADGARPEPGNFGRPGRGKRKGRKAGGASNPDGPAVPAVPPEVLAAQERLAELRAQPDAQAAAKLIGAWGGVRKTLIENESEAAAAFADRLRQPLQDLAEFRRNPDEGMPFTSIRAVLDDLHTEIGDSPFANEGFVPSGLARHTAVMTEFDAKEEGNETEESP